MIRILLIEQTTVLKKRIERLIESTGFAEVVTYQENLFSFKNTMSKIGMIDLVIIDYDQYMIEFDKFNQQIRESFKEPKVRMIVLTSKTDANDIMSFYTKGVDEVILKPFEDELIIRKLSKNRGGTNQIDEKLVMDTIKGGNYLFNWREDYEIGIDLIDQEHRQIIQHFDKLYELMKNGRGHEYFFELMEFLKEYVNTHFQHEEALHNEVNYPGKVAHKGLHEHFKKQIELMMAQYQETTISNADLVKLNMFIKEWLSKHILVEDRAVGHFIHRQKQ